MNPEIDDGGPAFPAGPFGDTMHGEDGRVRHQYPATEGMSLRDYFAGKALQALILSANLKDPINQFAKESYKMADAMILHRTAHLKSPN